ncbi:MAG: serine hydrolase [Vicingaceae bacterium]
MRRPFFLFTLLSLFLFESPIAYSQEEAAEEILNFMQKNPEKCAISLIHNQELIKTHRENEMMPLASTVKIMIALEFAYQTKEGNLKKEEEIPLSELDHFYVPNSDGGAHQAWINSLALSDNESTVSLLEIAKGMMQFSSNANSEYLLDRLGIEKVNQRIKALNYENHEPIYYFVSALFISQELLPDKENVDKKVSRLKKMSKIDYIEACRKIHYELKQDAAFSKSLKPLHIKLQESWSNRLPASTTSTYIDLMKKLNNKNHFPKAVQATMDQLMEGVMQSKANQKWLKHAGMKGGSTPMVLTKATYATDKDGDQTELVYFFNELDFLSNLNLQKKMNAFELMILKDKRFREKVKELKFD